jgi:hypothetical protein
VGEVQQGRNACNTGSQGKANRAGKVRQTGMVGRKGMAGLTGGEVWQESRLGGQKRET